MDNIKASHLKYRRTKKGLIKTLYRDQGYSSKMRGFGPPNYTIAEFTVWIIGQELFHKLHSAWEASGYKKEFRPSVDRKNDYIGYSFQNIQLMTWEDNRRKGNADRKNGINNKWNKGVCKYSLVGDFICSYYSAAEAGRQNNIRDTNISTCCRGGRAAAGGFKWQYLT